MFEKDPEWVLKSLKLIDVGKRLNTHEKTNHKLKIHHRKYLECS